MKLVKFIHIHSAPVVSPIFNLKEKIKLKQNNIWIELKNQTKTKQNVNGTAMGKFSISLMLVV